MIGIVAAIIAALGVGGALLLTDGLTPRPAAPRSKPTYPHSALWRELNDEERLLGAVALIVGIVVALASGWVVLIVVLPVAVVGVPRLVRNTSMKRSTDRLQALEDWTRSLSGVLVSGLVLENAIMASRRAAPQPIAKEVAMLCTRLRSGVGTEKALRAFARDLDDATADLVALMLIKASQFTGVALADQLTGVAASVSEDVRARRQTMAAQREPQSTASLMTWIMVGSLGLVSLMGDYIAPYGTPIGQIILAVLLLLFGALLVLMKRIATAPPPPRIMGPTSRYVENERGKK
ncbi:MAG: type II secretion system F family protein [Luteococcus sp.]|uniref:type II secretion system F family protein n=1 Tax=Luteococcus sp. TaxID=1969402 RepID=UPI002647EE7F|nr:type II secretion system F family protein [Luteococcus sp.]MDN5562570.1 type II secretion system F family protein [Luteococcus sp.]